MTANEAVKAVGKILESEESTLVLIQGIPGSGKSTLAKNILEYSVNNVATKIHWHEADTFFIDDEMQYRFDSHWLSEAHSYCYSRAAYTLFVKRHTIVSNTFTSDKELAPYISLAKKAHAKLVIVRMETQYESVHNVPAEAIERMKNRMRTSLTIPADIVVRCNTK